MKVLEKKSNSGMGNIHELTVKLKAPRKYSKLSRQDIDYINNEVIKYDSMYFISKNDTDGVYWTGISISKKKINQAVFIEEAENKFESTMKKFRRERK